MDEKKNNNLEDPMVAYGTPVRKEDLSFEPIPHMMATLRAQGCITHDELVERLAKYI